MGGERRRRARPLRRAVPARRLGRIGHRGPAGHRSPGAHGGRSAVPARHLRRTPGGRAPGRRPARGVRPGVERLARCAAPCLRGPLGLRSTGGSPGRSTGPLQPPASQGRYGAVGLAPGGPVPGPVVGRPPPGRAVPRAGPAHRAVPCSGRRITVRGHRRRSLESAEPHPPRPGREVPARHRARRGLSVLGARGAGACGAGSRGRLPGAAAGGRGSGGEVAGPGGASTGVHRPHACPGGCPGVAGRRARPSSPSHRAVGSRDRAGRPGTVLRGRGRPGPPRDLRRARRRRPHPVDCCRRPGRVGRDTWKKRRRPSEG